MGCVGGVIADAVPPLKLPTPAPPLVLALLALLCPTLVHAALPPTAGPKSETDSAAPSAAPAEPDAGGWGLALPPIKYGGVLSYNVRRDMSDDHARTQQGVSATLQAATNTFIWQPWFVRVNGTLGLTLSRDSGGGGAASKNIGITGSGQLSALPYSPYPFEAHFEKSDSRTSNDLAIANGYTSQRYGFSQNYFRPGGGTAMIGWDRNTQTTDATGVDRQDTIALNLSHTLANHRLQVNGNGTRNTHELSGEQAVQNNLALQHSYTPNPSISVDNVANIGRSGYRLQQGENDSRLVQLSSLVFWRPEEQPFTVFGGARVFALENETSGIAAGSNGSSARIRNANANLGVNYDFNQFTRINASANVNQAQSNGASATNSNQTLGVSYTPASIELGSYHYNWSTSGTGSNQTGAQGGGRQLSLQLSHSLARSIKLDGGSSVSMDGSQSLSASAASSRSNGQAGDPLSGLQGNQLGGQENGVTKRLSHSASLSWDRSRDDGSAQVRLSASDSRDLGGRREFFQLVNLQASSNLPAGQYGAWTGNLTVQAVRQSNNTIEGDLDPLNAQSNTASKRGFEVSSSASVSYQNQRIFNVRRLRFVSDLRLNSQALLPLLGSVKDQESAAWENRLDYAIGRTQLRLGALISRSSSPSGRVDPATGQVTLSKTNRTNKSIMFSATRGF